MRPSWPAASTLPFALPYLTLPHMATPKRILYIAGEVAPFARQSETADLVRTLSEHLQEHGNFEARITMPRYGSISERKNALHEVIRLSGTEISMGEETETLTVKVASIPGLRLQVYFMDNETYFGRKGIPTGTDEALYEDNAGRALFFARAVLQTIEKLRWAPDLVHAFGWMSGLAPALLRTEWAGSEVFSDTRVVYTPDALATGADLSADFAEAMHLDAATLSPGQTLADAGRAHADAVIYPPAMTPETAGTEQFDADEAIRAEQAVALYERLLSEVPA